MGEVVVIGAGLGGVAVAARLAKQRHRVTILERSSRPGGAFGRVERAGFSWDAGPTSTALPAVLRDLFRKSGRPLERYVELEHRPIARRHVFADASVVDLPTGSRGAQIDAVDAGLGLGTGREWAEFVDAQSEVWATLRSEVLDDPRGGLRLSDRHVQKALRSRTSLEKLLARSLADERLRQMVAVHTEVMGSHPRNVASYAAVQPYVERSFGVWQSPKGMAAVMEALVTRLDERGVVLRCDSPVASIDVTDGRAAGVVLTDGERIPADVVVADVDPRVVCTEMLPPGSADPATRVFATATPAIPPTITHLGIAGPPPDLPAEVVLHGDPLLVLTTTGRAPEGHHAWTVLSRGGSGEDVLVSLARRGLDVRGKVTHRVDRSARDLVTQGAGSAYGLAWDGWRAVARRAQHGMPLAGLHLVGASMHPGATVPFVGWGAAHAATLIAAELISPART